MSKYCSRKNRKTKLLTAFTAVILLQGLTTAFSSPNTTQIISPGDSANFTVESQANTLTLKIQPPKEASKTFGMDKSGDVFRTEIKGGNFSRKGLYRYSFGSGTDRYPEYGNFSLIVSSRNESLENKTVNVSDTESQLSGTDFCDYKTDPSDFDCEYENYQAGMILSSAVGLQLNKSSYAREKFENFTFGSYSDGTWGRCDHAEDDFDCETGSGPVEMPAGVRQGSLIYSLWEAYGLSGNDTVRELALNYTKGSAETCDVWNNSFNCTTARAQGLMGLGYWSAYEKTGNNTFKSIAENLTETNYSHPVIAWANLKGHVFNPGKSYLSEAENRTREWLNECPNCSSDEFSSLKNTLWTGYKITGEYGYYRNAVNLTAYSDHRYCSWNSSSCENPYTQGLSTFSYWKALKSQKDLPPTISRPKIDRETVVGENLAVNAEFTGKIKNPRLEYRRKTTGENSWIKCDINLFEGCEIPGENISQQAPYSYRFKSESLSFPKNGSFTFAPSLVKNTFLDEAKSFSTTDPERWCSPSEGDYSCEDTSQQASMIKGLTDLFTFNGSEKSAEYFKNILERPYVTESFFSPLCTPQNGYMSCEYGDSALERDIEGSVRQGKMIESLLSSYQRNGEGRTYQRAMNYTLGGAQDCDVWNRTYNKSFECGSTRGQAEMIEAYLKAYEVTGNKTFRGKALNLTQKALNMTETSRLGSALWKANSYFNESYRNLSISDTAENISGSFAGYCVDNCTVEQYLGSSNLFRDAFLHSEKDYSSEYRSSVLNTTADGECGPYKQDISCSYPSGQGGLMQLMWGSAYTMPVELKVESEFNVSKDTLTVGKEFSASCSAQNNLENTTVKNLGFELSTSEGLDLVSGNRSYDEGDLEYGNYSEVSWSIESKSPGDRNVSCAITSDSGYRDAINRDITVEEQETDGGGETSSGSESGGFVGGFTGGDSQRNITVVYTNASDMNWNRTLLTRLGINTTYRNFTERTECFRPVRKIRGENITLEADSSCTGDGAVLIDRIPSNVSLEKGRRVNDLAVARTPELENSTYLSLDYTGLNTSNFRRPLVLKSSYSLPPVRINFSAVNNQSAVISADLSREQTCEVYREGEKIHSEETSKLVYQPSSLDYGNSTYTVECGDRTFTKTFTKAKKGSSGPQSQESGQALPLIRIVALLSLLAVSGLVFDRRELIVEELGMKLFEYRFHRFEKAVENGDTAEAIEIFDSMSRDVSKEVLESDMDLMQGLMLYLLIDLVEEGKEGEVSFDVSGDLGELVQRYVKNSDGKSVRLVRDKYGEATGREI